MSDIRRADYRDLRLYTDDTGPCAIDLSDNTNQWGTPPERRCGSWRSCGGGPARLSRAIFRIAQARDRRATPACARSRS